MRTLTRFFALLVISTTTASDGTLAQGIQKGVRVPFGNIVTGGGVANSGIHLDYEPFPGIFTTEPVALLGSAYLDFSGEVDNELRRLSVQPAPIAPFIGNTFGVAVSYHDDGKDDKFRYFLDYHLVENDGKIITGEADSSVLDVNGKCTNATCEYPLPGVLVPSNGPYEFVLRGFDFEFTEDDYDIREIGVDVVAGMLRVTLSSLSSEDFRWNVKYAWVPSSYFAYTGTSLRNNVKNFGGRPSLHPIPEGDMLLRGFSLKFGDSPHELDEFGVGANIETIPKAGVGQIEVDFNDMNNDDGFHWAVDWAILAEPTLMSGKKVSFILYPSLASASHLSIGKDTLAQLLQMPVDSDLEFDEYVPAAFSPGQASGDLITPPHLEMDYLVPQDYLDDGVIGTHFRLFLSLNPLAFSDPLTANFDELKFGNALYSIDRSGSSIQVLNTDGVPIAFVTLDLLDRVDVWVVPEPSSLTLAWLLLVLLLPYWSRGGHRCMSFDRYSGPSLSR